MENNRFAPPASEVHDLAHAAGWTHWAAVPLGAVLSLAGVFVLEPMTVDFIVQRVLQLAPASRTVPMLVLDLFLSTVTLTITLYVVLCVAKPPKGRASAIAALPVVGLMVLLGSFASDDLKAWYQWLSIASVPFAWWLSRALYFRQQKREST